MCEKREEIIKNTLERLSRLINYDITNLEINSVHSLNIFLNNPSIYLKDELLIKKIKEIKEILDIIDELSNAR